jgi:hypothetical protein
VFFGILFLWQSGAFCFATDAQINVSLPDLAVIIVVG